MAQRFGGKYSPDGQGLQDRGPQDAPRPMATAPSKAQRRTRTVGLMALLFFIPGFTADARQMILSLAAGGLLLASAWMTREGLRAAEEYDSRRVARRPFPRKMLGAVLMALAMGAGGLISHTNPVYPGFFAAAGFVLHLLAFGRDPLRDKGTEGLDPFQTDRVARAVAEAEGHLTAMKDAILRTSDSVLEARVDRFADTARGLFRSIETDPGDLTAARKFLSVYLQGARDATVKFADLFAHNRSATARTDYEALLTDLETTFAARTTALLANGHTDLDVEISVLRDRLKLET